MGAFVFRKSGKISAITDGGEGTIYDLGNGSDVIKVYKPVVNIMFSAWSLSIISFISISIFNISLRVILLDFINFFV